MAKINGFSIKMERTVNILEFENVKFEKVLHVELEEGDNYEEVSKEIQKMLEKEMKEKAAEYEAGRKSEGRRKQLRELKALQDDVKFGRI